VTGEPSAGNSVRSRNEPLFRNPPESKSRACPMGVPLTPLQGASKNGKRALEVGLIK
jgi:hypothetical protein